jgi:hypothetical protein
MPDQDEALTSILDLYSVDEIRTPLLGILAELETQCSAAKA